MDVYVSFLKTVFQTIVTLVSAAAALFATSPGSPANPSVQDVSLRRAAFVRQVETHGSLLSRLASGDPVERTLAACEVQKERGARVRRQAAWALGAIGDRQGVDGLIKALLDDADGPTRAKAAWALGVVGR
jgi:HEAT repeat protein